MNSKWQKTSVLLLLFAVIFAYAFAAITGAGSGYSRDLLLGATGKQSSEKLGLDISADQVDVDRGVFRFTATPNLSGQYGESTGNGSFLQQPVAYSFDVFEGSTLVNPGAGELVGGQSLGIRLFGDPSDFPFDNYEGKFYVTAGVDGYNAEAVPLDINDKSTAIPGFAIDSKYISFLTESTSKTEIQDDINQGTGLIKWSISRDFSTIFAVFLFGGLMLVGAVASLLMTFSIVRGHRPPSINSLTWLAAFLFAIFQVRAQLPGDPPSGVKFDMLIFFPVILLLICLIMVNVSQWNKREDWDMENSVTAVRGKRIEEL
jgi:hypothetical protein